MLYIAKNIYVANLTGGISMSKSLNSKNSLGIICPACQCAETKILGSRRMPSRLKRERECLNCGFLFYTNEEILFDDSKIFIETTKGTVQKKTFIQIKADISKYLISDEDIQFVYNNVINWILNWQTKKEEKNKLYRLKKVATLPEKEYKKLVMATMMIINPDIATVFYLTEIATKKSQKVSRAEDLSKILEEVRPYMEEIQTQNGDSKKD